MFRIKYLIKGGGSGTTTVDAENFGDAECIFHQQSNADKVMSAIEFAGIKVDGLYYQAIDKLD